MELVLVILDAYGFAADKIEDEEDAKKQKKKSVI
jgi:hypothetical protein